MAAAVLCVLLGLLVAAHAFADAAPHVATDLDTETCAMCHRDHTSFNGATWTDQNGTTSSALLVGNHPGQPQDTGLCYSCHGVATLGSNEDIQSDFLNTSHHVLTPGKSTYGPADKQCSDCHDSHGSAKTTGGQPVPGLIRSVSITDGVTSYNSGDRYCTACHVPRANNEWDGYDIWVQTKHSQIAPTSSGTQIVCLACHDPHGSPYAPSIVTQLTPPSAPTTTPVIANDRWMCYGCHAAADSSYPGAPVYEGSSHGSSPATVSVGWEWASRDLSPTARNRRVGECQVCHDPMGRDDGTGKPLPKLAEASMPGICYTCHSVGSQIATDMASLAFKPTAGLVSVAAAYGADPASPQFGLAQVYTQEATSAATLTGPRQVVDGDVGPTAIGDIDGDGLAEMLVARQNASAVGVYANSALAGMVPAPGDVGLLAPASYMALGDVLNDVAGLPELVTADGTYVRVYRWNVGGFAVVGSVNVTGTVSGLAVGPVFAGPTSQIVVTTNGPDQLVIIDGSTDSLVVNGPYGTRLSPRGPSVGDLNADGRGEIAVANNGDPTKPLSVFDSTGSELYYYDASAATKPAAQSTLIADVLPGVKADGTTGLEIAETMADPVGGAAEVDVFPLEANAASLGSAQVLALPGFSNPSDMALGQLPGDSNPQLVVSDSGSVSHGAAPGLQFVTVDSSGLSLSSATFRASSGAEGAADTPGHAWVAIGNLGAIGPSRHAVEAASAAAHVSTESAGFSRHVSCADCHNPHESTATVAAAPAAYGAIRGAWGVNVLNAPVGSITYSLAPGVTTEYGLCLKCHGRWGASGTTRDIASEVDTRNPSFHGIEGPPSGSAVVDGSWAQHTPAWTNSSVMYCTDCHGNSDGTQPAGPHTSADAPLLVAPYEGVPSSDATGLCYRCHDYAVYYAGIGDGSPAPLSNFYDTTSGNALHHFHVATKGLGCASCHVTHGSRLQPHLLRDDIGYEHDQPAADSPGGSCQNGCHGGARLGYQHQ